MKEIDKYLVDLLKEKVVLAIGCTEPIAVALAVAKAHEVLGMFPDTVEINLSANVLKNAMGVGIPGTNMIGLPIAASLGLVMGNSKDLLEILRNVNDESINKAKEVIDNKVISFSKKEIDEKLYIEVLCKKNGNSSKVIISGTHTNFTLIEKDGQKILDKQTDHSTAATQKQLENAINISVEKIYDFIINCDIAAIKFILNSASVNKEAAKVGMHGNYGLSLNKIFKFNTDNSLMFKENALNYALELTTAAIDARMGGANVQIYSNSGSGDQGIAVTLPVLAYSEANNLPEDKLIRALALSHLIAIYIKQKLGVLSPFCGITTASIGAACGITFLMGGNLNQIGFAIKNFAGGIVGMICDGAKNGCAIKVSAAVFCAFQSATLAMQERYPSENEGIIHREIENTITNIVNIGKIGMKEVDNVILEMMLSKQY